MLTCGAENEAIAKLQFLAWPHEAGFKSESVPKDYSRDKLLNFRAHVNIFTATIVPIDNFPFYANFAGNYIFISHQFELFSCLKSCNNIGVSGFNKLESLKSVVEVLVPFSYCDLTSNTITYAI